MSVHQGHRHYSGPSNQRSRWLFAQWRRLARPAQWWRMLHPALVMIVVLAMTISPVTVSTGWAEDQTTASAGPVSSPASGTGDIASNSSTDTGDGAAADAAQPSPVDDQPPGILSSTSGATTSTAPSSGPDATIQPISPSAVDSSPVGSTPPAVPSPDSAIVVENGTSASATSGQASGSGTIAQNGVDAAQSSAVLAGGGSGDVSATNSTLATLTGQGTGTAKSGAAAGAAYTATTVVQDPNSTVTTIASSGGTAGTVADGSGLYTGTVAPPALAPPPLPAVNTSGTIVTGTIGIAIIDNASVTGATSGDATALGVVAQNVSSSSQSGRIVIRGDNTNAATLSASSAISIENTGEGTAFSGQAGASGGGALVVVGGPDLLSGTVAPGASLSPTVIARSTDVTAVGVTGNSQIATDQVYSATVSGGTGIPITLVSQQSVTVVNDGSASAGSGSASAQSPPAGTASASTLSEIQPSSVAGGATLVANNATLTDATSGNATAVGVAAQNIAAGQSDVSVTVLGDNFGLITVITRFVSRILNTGSADATTGSAIANGGAAITEVTSDGAVLSGQGLLSDAAVPSNSQETLAVSGDVTATGVRAQTQVQESSTQSLTVDGDNYNPITVFVQMVANVLNRGIAMVSSGSATSTGADTSTTGSSGSPILNNSSTTQARSGDAAAQGVEAQNIVSFNSVVAILIRGNNYAPITIVVDQEANITNDGDASASSGDAIAQGGSAITRSSGSQPSADATDHSASPSTTAPQDQRSTDPAVQTLINAATETHSGMGILGVNVESPTVQTQGSAQVLVNSQADVSGGANVSGASPLDGVISRSLSTFSGTFVRSGDATCGGNAEEDGININQNAVAQSRGNGTRESRNTASILVHSSGTGLCGELPPAQSDGSQPGGPGSSFSQQPAVSVLNNFALPVRWPAPRLLATPRQARQPRVASTVVLQGRSSPIDQSNQYSLQVSLTWPAYDPAGLAMPEVPSNDSNRDETATLELAQQTPSDQFPLTATLGGLLALFAVAGVRYRRNLGTWLASTLRIFRRPSVAAESTGVIDR